MGGRDAGQPAPGAVLEAYAGYDPLGAGQWWDPSMSARIQQLFVDINRNRARAADDTGLLENHVTGWVGTDGRRNCAHPGLI